MHVEPGPVSAWGKRGAILIDGENSTPGTDDYFNDSVDFKYPGCELMSQRAAYALTRSHALNQLVTMPLRASGTRE